MAVEKQFAGMEGVLNFFIWLVYKQRKWCVWFLALFTVFMTWQTLHIARDAGFDKSIPLDHPYMQVYKQYESDFGGANQVLVALILKPGVPGDIYNEEFLSELKAATDEVFFLPGVDRSRVSSLFTPDVRFTEVVEGGFRGGNVIPAEYAPTPEMFQKIRVNVGKAGVIGRHVTNDQRGAMIFSELVEVDPITGQKLDYEEVAHDLEDKVRGKFTEPTVYRFKAAHDIVAEQEIGAFKKGDVVFKKGELVVEEYHPRNAVSQFFHTFNASKTGPDNQAVKVPVSGRDLNVESADNPSYNPDISIHIIGFAKVVGDIIDATFVVVAFFGLVVLLTMLLLWWYLGDLRLAQLPLWCSVVAVIWEFGLLHTLGFGLDPFAILVPFLVLAVSTSHGIQYVNSWADEIEHGRAGYDASLETFRRLFIPGFLALLTDVAGFATITLVPIEIIREMAINACLGMAAIILTNKVMMPIWLSVVSVKEIDTFRARRHVRLHAGDRLWRQVAKVTNPGFAACLILASGVVLGFSLWKQHDRIVGDTQAGVPELRPDSRYNKDSVAINDNFDIGVDLMKIIAETDPESCIQYDVMDQIDRFHWHVQNTPSVRSALSLPAFGRLVTSQFSEANPKFYVLPRNRYALVQAITPIPPSTGMLNPDCSAMPVWIFTTDHRAPTIAGVVERTKGFNGENAGEFFEVHKDVDAAYCAEKTAARRDIGIESQKLARAIQKLKARNYSDKEINDDDTVKSLRAAQGEAQKKWDGFKKTCPVNFAITSGPVGVMAATNEVVKAKEGPVVYWVYAVIIVLVWLSFRNLAGLVSIVYPLASVSILANALMAMLGIGLKVATLPVVSLAVGIGVDYGIYIYAVLHDEVEKGLPLYDAYFETLRKTGKAVIFTGVSLAGSVLFWLFSDLQFQVDMGKLLAFMFFLNMLGAVILLPAICRFAMKLPKG